MQTSLKKTFARAGKEKGPPPAATKASENSKQSKPSLLRMLSSQMVVRPVSNAADTSAPANEANLAAAQPFARPAPPAQRPALETKACPLCGQIFPVGTNYDRHFAAEAAALADDSDDEWTVAATVPLPLPADEPARLPRPKRRAPVATEDAIQDGDDASAPKVYVLGGAPAVAVPRNPKKLRPLPPELRRTARRAPAAYNYYDDGGGFLDEEALGLDGAENVGVGWEGVGATTF